MSGIIQTFFSSFSATASGPSDSFFNRVTLLLPGTGTNGQTNNQFLDSSANNFTITRNGNTTQGTFTPYDPGYSVFFDGTDDAVTFSDTAAYNVSNGNFTIECWIYNGTTGSQQAIISQNNSTGTANTHSVGLEKTSANKLSGWLYGTSFNTVTSTADLPLNQWVHVAFVRDGALVTLYINGTQDGQINVGTLTVNDSANNWAIGRRGEQLTNYFSGYISNLRFNVGEAVYTSNFTTPTSALSPSGFTAILALQSNRFITNPVGITLTSVSGAAISAANPFTAFSPYNSSSNGGSAYFDGTGDYLTATNNAAFQFASGDFTVEAWIYFTAITGTRVIVQCADSNSPWNNGWTLVSSGSSLQLIINGSTICNSANVINTNTWIHVAATRSGTTCRLFVDGQIPVGGSGTSSANIAPTRSLSVGGDANNTSTCAGYISNLRIVKGSAQYTAAFTPPSSPVTTMTGTSLLLNFTNTGVLDATMRNVVETVTPIQIHTPITKWGNGSIQFDGSGRLVLPPSPNWLHNGDFTIESWIYFSASTGFRTWFSTENQGHAFTYGTLTANTDIYYGQGIIASNPIPCTPNVSLTTGTWYHFALTRQGSNLRFFVDGTLRFTQTLTNTMGSSTVPLYIGSRPDTTNAISGYIQDFRITNGLARYTANFSVPTEAFPQR